MSEGKWKQVLIFTRTKHGANRLAEKLNKFHIKSAAIHGNKSQNARTKALEGFKTGKVEVLVATDIAARGLDIPLLPHVINYELPNQPEDYVHRIGRTGRAGAEGDAISLVSHEEVEYVAKIEKLLKESFKLKFVTGFEPSHALMKEEPSSEKKKNKPKRPFKPRRNKNNSNRTRRKE